MELKDVYDELERLRKKEKISEEKLTEGIMSVRSYRRYHYLEHDMPFDKLEALCHRLKISIYDFLYYVEHNMNETNLDEAILLDMLIQDNYKGASKKLKSMNPSLFKLSSNQFLLPLFLCKLNVYHGLMTLEKANQQMFKGLNLKALLDASWMTVDHYILMEHLLPWMENYQKKMCQIIIQDVIMKKKILIRQSNYTMLKLHIFYILLSLELKENIRNIHEDIYSIFLNMYRMGSEIVVDEVFTSLITYQLEDDPLIKTLLNQYLVPFSYLYHIQTVHDDSESIGYIKKHHLEITFSLLSFKEYIF